MRWTSPPPACGWACGTARSATAGWPWKGCAGWVRDPPPPGVGSDLVQWRLGVGGKRRCWGWRGLGSERNGLTAERAAAAPGQRARRRAELELELCSASLGRGCAGPVVAAASSRIKVFKSQSSGTNAPWFYTRTPLLAWDGGGLAVLLKKFRLRLYCTVTSSKCELRWAGSIFKKITLSLYK